MDGMTTAVVESSNCDETKTCFVANYLCNIKQKYMSSTKVMHDTASKTDHFICFYK